MYPNVFTTAFSMRYWPLIWMKPKRNTMRAIKTIDVSLKFHCELNQSRKMLPDAAYLA